MNRLFFVFLVLSLAVAPTRGQHSNTELLSSTETLWVSVAIDPDDETRNCFPSEGLLKARIELALQQAGLSVTDDVADTPFVLSFETVSIYPGFCAVSYKLEVVLYYLVPETEAVFLVKVFERWGIFSRTEFSESRREMEKTVDDLVLMLINEILKARNNNR